MTTQPLADRHGVTRGIPTMTNQSEQGSGPRRQVRPTQRRVVVGTIVPGDILIDDADGEHEIVDRELHAQGPSRALVLITAAGMEMRFFNAEIMTVRYRIIRGRAAGGSSPR